MPRQFRYRWTENFLHSTLLDAKVGKNIFSIGGQKVEARAGVAGGGGGC